MSRPHRELDRYTGFTRRAQFLAVLAALVVGGVAAAPGWAAPGDLDRSFGGGTGVARVDFGALVPGAAGSLDVASAVAVQPDGRILLAGSSNAGGLTDMAVVRLRNPEGTLDTSFGPLGGGVRGSFGAVVPGLPTSTAAAKALAVQADGRIVVAGELQLGGDIARPAVARLLGADGSLDPSFGAGGRDYYDLGGLVDGGNPASTDPMGGGLALQPDGGIVVAGSTNAAGTFDMGVFRARAADGAFDPSFGPLGGGALINFGALVPGATRSSDFASSVAVQPDGRIVLGGFSSAAGTSDFAVARVLNPEGTLDPSYGLGTGASRVDLGGAELAPAIALQPDGRIVLAGTSGVGADPDAIVAVRLRSPQGIFDESFGSNGAARKLISPARSGLDPAGLAIQGDGKIVIAGTVDKPVNSNDLAIVRLQPNGTLDSSFGDAGRRIIDLGGDERLGAIALQRDGGILLAATIGVDPARDMAVLRLQGDPPGAGSGGSGGSGASGGAGGAGGTGGGSGGSGTLGTGAAGSPPRCAGRRATLVGTNGRDRLRGTSRADVIVALGGRDTITGAGGNDIICAGAGDDSTDGGTGNDRLYGQDGKDRLLGGAGTDQLTGGAGNDRLAGQNGSDRLSGGSGNDRLDGGAGNDRLLGQTGRDQLLGRAGRDRLDGGPGRDRQQQ